MNLVLSSFSIGTPALLFPTLSLLMLAYTNRFLSLATVIRKLHEDFKSGKGDSDFYLFQIESLGKRVKLTVQAQIVGTLSLISCVVSMLFYFWDVSYSIIAFGFALLLMTISLFLTFEELLASEEALKHILNDCKRK